MKSVFGITYTALFGIILAGENLSAIDEGLLETTFSPERRYTREDMISIRDQMGEELYQCPETIPSKIRQNPLHNLTLEIDQNTKKTNEDPDNTTPRFINQSLEHFLYLAVDPKLISPLFACLPLKKIHYSIITRRHSF